MKKILLGSALTALLCNANAEVDQSLTGLHIGLGINVLFDEYSSDVDVAEAVFGNDVEIGIAEGFSTKTDAGDGNAATIVQNNAQDAAAIKHVADAMLAAAKNGQTSFTWQSQDFSTEDHGILAGTGEVSVDTENGAAAWVTKRQTFKRRATNVGGELKLAYFHDFGNKFMIGVDLSGTIVSKTKKHVKNPLFASNSLEKYTVQNTGGATVEYAKDGSVTIDAADGAMGGDNEPFAMTVTNDTQNSVEALKSTNANYTVYTVNDGEAGGMGWGTLTPLIKNNHIIAGDKSEVAFEKDAFIPRLAFVLGGTYLGWFAGVRLGMAYMTGKVTATDANGSHSKSVSISSPFIGLHLMKQMNIKGINNGHVYVTADWHVGDGHRAVNINGIKSFKQNAFNLAAGLTWRCKLGR